jgi:2-polyprenyl-3-methyl-5-hydroxy-6-metoxy-1,4-benzoquinol methylase
MWKRLRDPEKPIAEYYDDAYAALDYFDREAATRRALTLVRDAITEAIGGAPMSLLDVGCGPGVFLSLAREAGFDVTGVELEPTLADKARARGIEVLTGDVVSIPMGERRFDVITLLDLIEHVPEPVALLERCRQLLKPGGHVVVYTPNHDALIVRVAAAMRRFTLGRVAGPIAAIFDGVHIVFFDRTSLTATMVRAGLQPVRTKMIAYDAARSEEAKGASTLALKMIETVSPLVQGQFRILMFGRAR